MLVVLEEMVKDIMAGITFVFAELPERKVQSGGTIKYSIHEGFKRK